MSRLRYVVLPEVEEVRRVVAVMDGRVRWPREITEACVLKLRAAGLVPSRNLGRAPLVRCLRGAGTSRGARHAISRQLSRLVEQGSRR